MVKISDCSYMEIKKIYLWSIEVSGGKAICSITLTDIDKYRNPKKIHISLSNLYSLMNSFDIKNMSEIIRKEVKCMINEKNREISFIAPLTFEKKKESDFIRCNQVHLNAA